MDELKNKDGLRSVLGQIWEERALWRSSRRVQTDQKSDTLTKGQNCNLRATCRRGDSYLSPRRQNLLEACPLYVCRLGDIYPSPRRSKSKISIASATKFHRRGDVCINSFIASAKYIHRLGDIFISMSPRRHTPVAAATLVYIRKLWIVIRREVN